VTDRTSTTSTTSTLRARGLAAIGAVLVLGVAGCGGGDDGGDTPSTQEPASTSASATASAATTSSGFPGSSGSSGSSGSPTPTPSSYLPVPSGVSLSAQGSTLAVGETATVAWQPRQDVTGVIDVTIDRLERTSLKKSFAGWKIPPETKDARPYFVRASVTNRGATDLGGRTVPLYIVDATDTLIEATSFASVFKPCRRGEFPTSFPSGASAKVCLVYFAPDAGKLEAVSFRPTQEFNPITWTGELLAPRPAKGAGTG